MATIRLQDVTKVYSTRDNPISNVMPGNITSPELQAQKIHALDHLNLVVPDGKTLTVVGPSGCGKSTLLRVIAGLITDYTGHVFYDDQDMKEVAPKDRYIGMIFQNYALYPHFYGKGNLKFNFIVRQSPDAEAEERIRTTSELMGIGFKELLKRKPGTLSGGQQQRVAIARALVRMPKLMLCDEPLSNLDAKLRTQTRVEIKRLLQRFQITTLYVTHDQVEAIALGDEIAIMREGIIIQKGTYRELYEQPTNAFVAGFLGTPPMNLLEGIVDEGFLYVGDTRVLLPQKVANQVHNGQALQLGIHPEDAAPLGNGGFRHNDRQVMLRLQGIVEVIEPDFARHRQIIYVRTGDYTYSVQIPQDRVLNIGYKIELGFPAEALYFFDKITEERLGVK
ncbi:MAG: ABC transporter ATP-binding protein [Anaerolineae bacterium]|nr:ABC transporter ATP-binding protein [Anaerolineae bacterium]